MTRAPREAPPPGRFIRTARGRLAEVVSTRKRDPNNRKLYRLWYGMVLGNKLWTLDELMEQAKDWLMRQPKELPRRGGALVDQLDDLIQGREA